ncbi:MAG: HAMP domain-containing histidine kinase [Burkholderiaceae bacterium]|nr:HAMP domain-containing histidine kinase [Burkholderiaceae bacterium]
MIKTDLRFRIAAAITLTCIVLVTITGALLYAASEALEESLVDQLVSEELNFLIQHHREYPTHTREVSPSVTHYVVTDAAQEAALPTFVRGLAPGLYDIDIGEGKGERHVALRDVGTTRYLVVYDLGPYEEREEEFKLLVAGLLLLIILITPFIGIFLSNFLVRQLTQLTQKVAVLSPDGNDQPLYQKDLGKEVGILAQTLDAYQLRIREMLQREQEFTANVSHELRTPLTEIRTSCELLAGETEWTDKSRARVRYIAKAEQDMRAHMEALLFLARDQADASQETVALRECVEDIVAPLQSDIAAKGLALDIAIDAHTKLQLNRKALHLVLLNILKNAVNFTEAGGITLAFDGTALTISDTGVGIAADALPKIFDRHYRGSDGGDGFGIGLDIVKRICEREQWLLQLHSDPAIGTTVQIDFQQTGVA